MADESNTPTYQSPKPNARNCPLQSPLMEKSSCKQSKAHPCAMNSASWKISRPCVVYGKNSLSTSMVSYVLAK